MRFGRKTKVVLLVLLALIAGGAIGLRAYWRWKFPYGCSHCCIIGMRSALESYADDHGGRYPAGGATPEASLSLLCKGEYADAYALSGMTVPPEKTEALLKAGLALGPDSCGWHYVEGLTKADDRKIGVLWCKAPLGHNGDRTRDGGRQVVFVDGDIEWIAGDAWSAFVDEQHRLLAEREPRALVGAPLVTACIVLPDGTRVDRLDCMCTVNEVSKGPGFSSSGTSSGGADLVWYHAPCQDGYVTRTISFSNLVSEPVTVTFTNGLPDLTNVVFTMRSVQ